MELHSNFIQTSLTFPDTEKLSGRTSFLSRGGKFFIPEEARVVINLKKLLRLYISDPITQRAVDMKATDLLAKDFGVDRLVVPDDVSSNDWNNMADELDAFLQHPGVDVITQFYRMAKDAMVFGNGFREVIYHNDKVRDAEKEPDGEGVERLVPIHPSQVIIIEDDREGGDTYGDIIYYMVMPPGYHLRQTVQRLSVPYTQMGIIPGEGKLVHPDRVLHEAFSYIGDANVGISLLEPIYTILKSKIISDEVIGTILAKQAKAIPTAQIENATPDQIRKMMKILFDVNKNPLHSSPVVTDETVTKLDFIGASGKVIDPTNFYKILYDNISVNFGIPRTILLGAETGTISGSDMNLAAYLKTISSDQRRVVEPLVKKLLRLHWKSLYDEELPVTLKIWFEQLYADEIGFVKSRFMDVQSGNSGWNAGTMTLNEARRIMRLPPIETLVKDMDGNALIEKPAPTEPGGKSPLDELPPSIRKDIEGE